MKKSVLSLVFPFSLLLSLLFGCRTGRQSYSNRGMAASSLSSCSDSLLLRRIDQLRQNRTVQLEHIVYSLSDSLQPEPVIQSVTRITSSEQTDQQAVTSLSSATVEEVVTDTKAVMEQRHSLSASSFGWWGIGISILVLVVLLKYRMISR